MQIVTGYAGQAHITSNDDQGRNQGTFGEDSYVLSVGSKFEPTLVSANQLRIADGEAVMQGVHFRVEPSSFDTVSIANGTQGRNRKDLVVCRYQKNGSTGVESCQWVVIQGTATTGTATRPDFVRGDILDGALSADMPFFEIVLSGVNVTAVNRIYNTVLSMEELQTIANQNRDSISVLNTNTDVKSSITLTKSTNCGSVTLNEAYRIGKMLYFKMTVTPSTTIAAGGNLDVTFSGFTPKITADWRFGYAVAGQAIFLGWISSSTLLRMRQQGSGTWGSSTSVVFSGMIPLA